MAVRLLLLVATLLLVQAEGASIPNSYVYIQPLEPPRPSAQQSYRPPLAPVQYSVSTNVQSSPVNNYQPPLLARPSSQPPLTSHLQPQDLALLLQRLQQQQQQQQQYDSSSFYRGGTLAPPAAPLNGGAQSMSITTSYTADVVRQGAVDKASIQKAPASEIQGTAPKSVGAKEKAAEDDEYVVYYYYYYDDDATNKNLSLNFDDIPNLEQYDSSKRGDGAKKLADRGRTATPSNGIQAALPLAGGNTQPRSSQQQQQQQLPTNVAKPTPTPLPVASPSPISNVFRYGSGDIPRVPVTPNIPKPLPTSRQPFPSTTSSNASPSTDGGLTSVSVVTTTAAALEATLPRATEDTNDIEIDTEESVQDATETEPTTTTTEAPTTTEEPTTTTERSRRRLNSRRRGGSGSQSASSRPPTRSSTTSTTPAIPSSPPRRGSQISRLSGNRSRRPSSSFSSNRIRASTEEPSREGEPSEASTRGSTTSTTSSRRFGGSSSQSRFGGSSRNRQTSSTTQTPSTTPANRPVSRSRPTPPSRSNAFSSSRDRSRTRQRQPFFRTRQQQEENKQEESTTAEPRAETAEPPARSPEPNTEVPADQDGEQEVTIAPTTTTERSRGVFRTRSRSPLFNSGRPRPNPLARTRSR